MTWKGKYMIDIEKSDADNIDFIALSETIISLERRINEFENYIGLVYKLEKRIFEIEQFMGIIHKEIEESE